LISKTINDPSLLRSLVSSPKREAKKEQDEEEK